MKILVTGAKGQLGSELKKISENSSHQFVLTDAEDFDITDGNLVFDFFQREKPDGVINCAAYTAVDKAEEEQDKARKLNVEGPAFLTRAAKETGAFLCHVSTDYVYGGENFLPYTEESPTKPQSTYGETKLKGELEVLKYENSCVIRTSWLYSSFGNNFVKTMLRLGRDRDEVNVIFDQIGTPTYAEDLAKVLVLMIEKGDESVHGIYNFSNEGVCSWYDLAKESINFFDLKCKVIPIETKDYPLPAKRPFYSVLNKGKIKNTLSIEIPHWRDSLKKCLTIINNSYGD